MMIRTKHIEEYGLTELSAMAKINKISEELQDDIYFIVPTGLYTSAMYDMTISQDLIHQVTFRITLATQRSRI